MSDMVKRLSTMPKHIEEMKKSAARKGLITALRWSLSYAPELKPEEIARGFPEYKDDGLEFTHGDYAQCMRAVCPTTSQLAEGLDLTKYQATYDESHKRVPPPTFAPVDLTPQRRKHLFASNADPSTILAEEAKFNA
ncbi:hypothetical protein ZWY2020_010795 [Hordeum vulgare]|nr:hypothetical protein ZWY2020_010795 [Hordeum vulgare]